MTWCESNYRPFCPTSLPTYQQVSLGVGLCMFSNSVRSYTIAKRRTFLKYHVREYLFTYPHLSLPASPFPRRSASGKQVCVYGILVCFSIWHVGTPLPRVATPSTKLSLPFFYLLRCHKLHRADFFDPDAKARKPQDTPPNFVGGIAKNHSGQYGR